MGVNQSTGFFETVKFKAEQFFYQSNLNSSDFIRLISSFGIGFVIGLIVKRYCKYIIMFAIFSALLLSVLHYFDLILINQVKAKMLLGFQGTETCDVILQHVLFQAKAHFLEFGIMLLGCLLGFKVG